MSQALTKLVEGRKTTLMTAQCNAIYALRARRVRIFRPCLHSAVKTKRVSSSLRADDSYFLASRAKIKEGSKEIRVVCTQAMLVAPFL